MIEVRFSIPYEDDSVEWFSTLKEAKNYINNSSQSKYDFSYDNIRVAEVKEIDIYELMTKGD